MTGLICLAAFLAVVVAGPGLLIGLVERGAVYPFLIGLICAGASIRRGNREAMIIRTGHTRVHETC